MPMTFPYAILKVKAYTLDLVGQVVQGGLSQSGQQQVVSASGGGLWALRMDFPTLRRPDQIRAWRVIQYGSDGGVVKVNVSICDIRQAPFVPGDFGGVPHSDGSPFSDGSLYASTKINGLLAMPAALRATSLLMTFANGEEPLGGEFFSLQTDDEHELHVITAVEAQGNAYALTIRPPLRRAYAAEVIPNFDHPTCTMRLATPDAMSLQVEYGRRGEGSAAFIEVVP